MDKMTLWASSVRRVAEVGYFCAFAIFCLPAAISIAVFFPADNPRVALAGTACMQCILAATLPFSRDATFCAVLLVESTLNVVGVFLTAVRVHEDAVILAVSAAVCLGIWAAFVFFSWRAIWPRPPAAPDDETERPAPPVVSST